MNKPREPYWQSIREEEFHEAIRQWLHQTGKNFAPEDDIGAFTQFLPMEEQADLAEHFGMTLKELKECLVHGVVYPDEEQAKRWKWWS